MSAADAEPTLRDRILEAIASALNDLAAEVEIEPTGDPIEFPSLAIFDEGHLVLERDVAGTRRSMAITIQGFVQGAGGRAPTAARTALQAAVVRALLADETLGGLVELIEDGDLRNVTATLASARRLMFTQDFDIQFSTSRADPALPA